MKRIVIAVLALLLAGTAWGQEIEFREIKTGIIRPMRVNGELINPPTMSERNVIIKEWAASGDICRVLGHRLEYKQEWDNYTGNPCPKPKKEMRYCPICNKTETKKEVWE